MQQRKVKIKKKHTERPKRSTSRGTPRRIKRSTRGGAEKHLWETACPWQSWPIWLSLSPCTLCKKTTIRDHKRSTRETRGFAKTGHQQVQSESTDEAPESTNQRPRKEHQRDQRFSQTEHQQAQSDSTNEAPENTIRDQKRSTRETRDFAKTEHQQVQSKSTNEAPDSKHQRDQRFAKTEHQQVQSGSTNEAPENTIRDHKRSTRETRGFAKNGAPASPIRERK